VAQSSTDEPERPYIPEDTNTETAKPLLIHNLSSTRPYLIVLAGSAMGAMHLIDRDVSVIGRSEKAHVRIIDDGISREHSRIVRKDGKMFVEDLASTNGTFCNGARVTSHTLAEGDKIMIGSGTILKFTYHDQIDEIFQRQLTESALRDPLTGTYNKRFFVDRVANEFAYAERHHAPLALLFLDIDLFKSINDTHGHAGGDVVLRDVASLMTRSLRNEDVVARFGGEEFAIIGRGIDAVRGRALAQRICTAIANQRIEVNGAVVPVTVSIGVACLPDLRIRSANDLVVAADEAMYDAKRAGRNRVRVRAPYDGDEEETGKV